MRRVSPWVSSAPGSRRRARTLSERPLARRHCRRRAPRGRPARRIVPPLLYIACLEQSVQRRASERCLVHLAAASGAGRLTLGLLGLLLRVLLAPEHDLAVLRVHEDGVPLLELTREDLLRERVDHQALDRPFDRTCAVDGIEPLLRDERLRVLG